MFNRKTVLVLGAGASAPYGYPLGKDLIESITGGIDQGIQDDARIFWNEANVDFAAQPYASLLSYAINRNFAAPSRIGLRLLADKLRTASHQSIDDFARTNPTLKPLVKVAIALELYKITYDGDLMKDNVFGLNRRLSYRGPDNWYSRFVSKITDNCHSVPDCCRNNAVSVITFNYDSSLEHYLDRYLGASELFQGIKVEDVVPIVHIHGKFDLRINQSLSFASQVAGQLLSDNSRFSLMGDDRNPAEDPAVVARRMLFEANDIFVLGFDLHPSNVELLNLRDVAHKVAILNFDGSPRLERRAKALGINTQNRIWKPRDGGTYSIAKAIDDGLFE